MPLTVEMIVFLTLGAAAGGFINGLSGTGTALFAMGFYLIVLDPLQAVAIVALMSVLAGVQGAWIVRQSIQKHPIRLARFLVPGLCSLPLGVMALSALDDVWLRMGIGALLISYGLVFGFRATLPELSRPTPRMDVLVGAVGGFLGGVSGASGAVPAVWLSMRNWPKADTRAVLQPFNICILTLTVAVLAVTGAFTETALWALVITIPVGLMAAQVGIMLFRVLSNTQFRRLLILLSLATGIVTWVGVFL